MTVGRRIKTHVEISLAPDTAATPSKAANCARAANRVHSQAPSVYDQWRRGLKQATP